MKRLFVLFLMIIAMNAIAQSVKDRVVHNDPAKYKELSAVHAGAGKMEFTQLIGRNELSTNFLYLHAGVIHPKSGIGHHFHHNIEEMYVLLNGAAEFTINGRTSTIKAPAIVPCKMGDAHAIYNPSGERLRWLNFAVSVNKGRGDAFDLGDARVGVKTDPTPVFVSARLERDKLKANDAAYGGKGVLYRRMLGPEVFSTDWAHVDHVVIPAGSAVPPRQLEGVEEVYYVIKGSGEVAVNEAKMSVKADDTFFGGLGEKVALSNAGNEDLEVLVIGIAPSKEKGLMLAKPLTKPKAMALQMDFVVAKENADAFEKMYYSIYVPAMTVQQGYLGSKLLRLFSADISKTIEAEPTTYNYQIQISFDTEENRRKWVASSQHQIAWPSATALAKEYKWRGYDVMGDDDQR
ncbi:cupin domain-containing protein [Chryseolinea sp. H1M3-3]|uniref:cupin domain-containing protein n=1 Tax=Chryseolinea sp. H1M3-3 TaxID=3034144 RepID=UPI0023EDA1E3|nr:cupin domain-containing protein [Chryseolinea sp. H1M3-3]